MQVLPVNRLLEPRTSLLPRDHARSTSLCSTLVHAKRQHNHACTYNRQRQQTRLALNAQATQAPVAFQSVDESVWDKTYADKFGPLHYGLATLQGPRDDMEDYASIVARGKCGFLYAGNKLYVIVPCDVLLVWDAMNSGQLAAIFDGHGGRSAADYMSNNLYAILSHSIDDETHNSESDVERKYHFRACCCGIALLLLQCLIYLQHQLVYTLKTVSTYFLEPLLL